MTQSWSQWLGIGSWRGCKCAIWAIFGCLPYHSPTSSLARLGTNILSCRLSIGWGGLRHIHLSLHGECGEVLCGGSSHWYVIYRRGREEVDEAICSTYSYKRWLVWRKWRHIKTEFQCRAEYQYHSGAVFLNCLSLYKPQIPTMDVTIPVACTINNFVEFIWGRHEYLVEAIWGRQPEWRSAETQTWNGICLNTSGDMLHNKYTSAWTSHYPSCLRWTFKWIYLVCEEDLVSVAQDDQVPLDPENLCLGKSIQLWTHRLWHWLSGCLAQPCLPLSTSTHCRSQLHSAVSSTSSTHPVWQWHMYIFK